MFINIGDKGREKRARCICQFSADHTLWPMVGLTCQKRVKWNYMYISGKFKSTETYADSLYDSREIFYPKLEEYVRLLKILSRGSELYIEKLCKCCSVATLKIIWAIMFAKWNLTKTIVISIARSRTDIKKGRLSEKLTHGWLIWAG